MMKLTTALGVAFASLTVAAYADPEIRNIVVRHGGPNAHAGADADHDGWISRAEAGAAAERMFDQIDANDDGRLTGEDHANHMRMGPGHPPLGMHMESGAHGDCEHNVEGDGGERRVTVTCHGGPGGEGHQQRHVTILNGGDLDPRDMERIERAIERATERAERAARSAERAAEDAERRVERRVVVMQGGPDAVWTDGDAPMPPHPPMLMMMHGGDNEADLDGDGALSRDEFRAQHLRFFDASDANGDGRVRIPAPPQPPTPPTPPAPPAPPAPPR